MRRPLCNLTTIKQEKPLINVNGRDLDQPPVKLIYHFSYYHHNSINIKLQAMPYRHSTEESNKELLYQYALTGLKSGEYSSVYSVAKTPKISEATFHNRLQGRPPSMYGSCQSTKPVRLRRKYSCQMDYNFNKEWITSFIYNYQRNG